MLELNELLERLVGFWDLHTGLTKYTEYHLDIATGIDTFDYWEDPEYEHFSYVDNPIDGTTITEIGTMDLLSNMSTFNVETKDLLIKLLTEIMNEENYDLFRSFKPFQTESYDWLLRRNIGLTINTLKDHQLLIDVLSIKDIHLLTQIGRRHDSLFPELCVKPGDIKVKDIDTECAFNGYLYLFHMKHPMRTNPEYSRLFVKLWHCSETDLVQLETLIQHMNDDLASVVFAKVLVTVQPTYSRMNYTDYCKKAWRKAILCKRLYVRKLEALNLTL